VTNLLLDEAALPRVAALVCFDMAGTTVADDGVVERAFAEALDELGVGDSDPRRPQMVDYVRATMGRSKIEVFRELFSSEERAQMANGAFEQAFANLVRQGAVVALPGAEETLAVVRQNGAKVALTTGFSSATRELIIDMLNWHELIDLALSPSDAGRGRPFPDMNVMAALQLGLADLRALAVAGDTRSDMVAATRSGATWRIGVRSGADDTTALLSAGATHVIDTVVALPQLVGLG
jgi:phosphoglycolate phosphatase